MTAHMYVTEKDSSVRVSSSKFTGMDFLSVKMMVKLVIHMHDILQSHLITLTVLVFVIESILLYSARWHLLDTGSSSSAAHI
jgi:hypothetical protein